MFIASCWDGSRVLKNPPASVSFDNFKDLFNKHDDPLQYSMQELNLKKYMAEYKIKGNTLGYQEAFDLFKILRDKRQRIYYNKLRIRWLKSIGSSEEKIIHKQIRNDAELVFSNPGDARYEKIRRDEWGK